MNVDVENATRKIMRCRRIVSEITTILFCIMIIEGNVFANDAQTSPWLDASGRMNIALATIDGDADWSNLITPHADTPQADTAQETPAVPQNNRYNQAGSWRWALYGSFADDVNEDSNNYNLHYSASKFFTDDFNMSFELGGMYFDQDEPNHDTGGINANILIRWHFVNREKWSLYLDGGAGLLYVDKKVPYDGSNLNMTPQAGFGGSYQLDTERDIRLFGGIRWHHVSNANLAGSDENPGRDSIMAYIGLDFPIKN